MSTQGYLIALCGGPIAWKSTKQKTVTTSTTEAELLALSYVGKEVQAITRLFLQMRFYIDEIPVINCDNQQTVGLVNKEAPQLTTKLRHVDIHQFWLRQEVSEDRIKVNWVPTTAMPADGLTKPLSRQKHEDFVKQLGLVDITKLLSGVE